jgi:hypothetical protein
MAASDVEGLCLTEFMGPIFGPTTPSSTHCAHRTNRGTLIRVSVRFWKVIWWVGVFQPSLPLRKALRREATLPFWPTAQGGLGLPGGAGDPLVNSPEKSRRRRDLMSVYGTHLDRKRSKEVGWNAFSYSSITRAWVRRAQSTEHPKPFTRSGDCRWMAHCLRRPSSANLRTRPSRPHRTLLCLPTTLPM